MTIETSVVRATQPNAQGLVGRGIEVQARPTTGMSSTLFLRRSLVEQSHEFGVFVEGSDATLEASVIRSTQLGPGGFKGSGVNVQAHMETGAASHFSLERSLVDQNHEMGVFVEASVATLDASVVRGTLPTEQALFGRGVGAQLNPTTGAPSTLWLHHSLVENNHDIGVFIDGSEATLEASIIRATQLKPDGRSGRGVNVQARPQTGTASTVHLESSLIEQSHEAAVFVISSVATIASCEFRDTLPDANGLFGEGVGVASEFGPASVTITATRIDQSARAALAAWGAHAAIGNSVLRCHAFDLDAETYQGTAATLDDLGGNLCGCPEASAPCKAVSANLTPPPNP